MSPGSRSGSARYELTIVGTLGPVLQRALEPYASAARQPQTILRASLPESGDLVDLLELLEARGVDVTDITAL